ncbi:hypothetical protein GDO86_000541 [Hymenochirus boettgeri]|uniref:OTU domain-containing protein 4 n=1 Tax=Hymenochirus boettgeri TaxID=247094 RepID=A0A8T2KC50_9PIPI|nr:hypothetical protein GDO86_000541 [Hymenochirus boettgeri]
MLAAMDIHGNRGNDAISKDEAAMDAFLRSEGLYRKRIAKDGSCLFRAVAEQVLHSQTEHLKIRKSCIDYLRENRGQYEAFIEGSFEEYLKNLENPQEWVGQVEISALSLMFKKDFIIYQEPNVSPSYVTENGFPEKIMLCFSNGNHYDIIYPIAFAKNAAMCQSIIYELLYEKVLGVKVGRYVLKEDMDGIKTIEEVYGSDESGSEVDEEVSRNKSATFTDMNGFKSYKDQKSSQRNSDPGIPPSVLQSLNSTHCRNVEYDVWLKSQRDQQKLDFSIAAGMQYSVGDKCQVRVQDGGKFYNAHIQKVGTENGPAVVFVEELGTTHSVQLKHLKPIPQTIINADGWNTVAARKPKKTFQSGINTPPEKDHRGQKVSGKSLKQQIVQPPRLQQAGGSKQQGLSQSTDQFSQCENTERRTPPKVPGRKVERERSQELNYFKRENVFGLTAEERKVKEAIEESKSLYEMQSMDKDAFPALSSSPTGQQAVQSADVFPVKRVPVINTEASARRSEGEDQRVSQAQPLRDDKCSEEAVKPFAATDLNDLPHAPVLPTSADYQSPPTVPSISPDISAWPVNPAQIPSLAATGTDSSLMQPQGTSSPYSPVPVSMPAVNQPLLPIPQTLSAYQDPLYPGFPFNEKGERAAAPPYSFCKNGGDLPNDKSILRFFFNLGIKAYTYPMWPPHSHLYPLHQAYLNICRMYPNIPVYTQGPWVQEASVNQSEVDPSVLVHLGEVRMEGQASQPSAPPIIASPIQVPGISQMTNQCESGVINQTLHPGMDFQDPITNKTAFPHSAFGQNYMGAVPVAPPFFSHFWYGYPYQGYIENPVMRQNVFMPPQGRDVPDNHLLESVVENNSSDQQAIRQSLDLQRENKPNMPFNSAPGSTCSAPVSNPSTLQNTEQKPNMNVLQVPIEQKNLTTIMKDNQAPAQIETSEEGSETSQYKETSKSDSVSARNIQKTISDEKVLKARDESSEDEGDVSHMLSSGRSKNFYSQSYNTRRPRNGRFYQSNRGGYQPLRGEEGWRGHRGSDDGYQHHRNFRGRPYRRRHMTDNYRAQQE